MRCPDLNELPSPPPGKIGWPWLEGGPRFPNCMPDGAQWPKLSIVTPSLNQGEFVEETLRSVLLQGYPDLEYIVIDGGSTDDSVGIISKYESWLTYWVSESDKGQTDAIGKGFDKATGVRLGWINSDDMLMPGALYAVALLHQCFPQALIAGSVSNFNADRGRVISFINGILRCMRCCGYGNALCAGTNRGFFFLIQPIVWWVALIDH